jgi:hypothetical protein
VHYTLILLLHSWAALIIDQQYGTPFAASISTSLSIHIQPAQAEDGRGPLSSYTGSLSKILEKQSAALHTVVVGVFNNWAMNNQAQIPNIIFLLN